MNKLIGCIAVSTWFWLTLWHANNVGSTNTVVAQVLASQEAGQGEPFDQNKKLLELGKQISGKETMPSEEVFKNIQMFKGMPAGRLLKVMEVGFGKSLGVNCTHCHVPDQWEKDDRPAKQVAREMMKMVGAINNNLLKNIKNLKTDSPTVNCTTCHRGQIKPALNMP